MQLFRRKSKRHRTTREATNLPAAAAPLASASFLLDVDLETSSCLNSYREDSEPPSDDRDLFKPVTVGHRGNSAFEEHKQSYRLESISPVASPLLPSSPFLPPATLPTPHHHHHQKSGPALHFTRSRGRNSQGHIEDQCLYSSSPVEEAKDIQGSDQASKSTVEALSRAAFDWLNNHKSSIQNDHHLNSWDLFQQFLDCAYTTYLAGKSGWDVSSPADHFASTIDQAATPNFRDTLIQNILTHHYFPQRQSSQLLQTNNVVMANPNTFSGSSESHDGSSSLLAIMPGPPPPTIMSSQVHGPASQHIPSLFQKDVFLDWHSKFAFSRPIRLGSKEVRPTIQLPALAGRSNDIPTAALSQERQSSVDKEPEGSQLLLPSLQDNDKGQLQPPGLIMETPHPEMYQPHSGLIELGRSLYTPTPEPQWSESILNRPRLPERRAAPISSPSIISPKPLSAAPQSESDIQLLDADAEGESLVIYGNPNLQQAILSGEMDAHAMIDQARHEEENGLHILGPLVTKAVLEGSYDVVVQLIQRNMQCIDVAIQVAEENGKFALVKYLGMWKEHHRKYGNQPAGRYTPSPGPSRSDLPRMPRKPKKIDDSDDDSYPQKPWKTGRGNLAPYDQRGPRGPSSRSRSRNREEDLAVGEDDSEETWKLRAIFLLILMITLSETTSTEGTGWDSVSTASSSRQSSQAPVDGGDHHAHSGTASRLTLPPGGGRRMGSDGGKKKRKDDDDSEESEGNRRQNNRPRRPSNLRSLGRRYACPFAKAQPDNHVTCWTINRQNLAGVKEHLKRFHFGGTLPSDIRAARTWDDVFDCIAPDWGSRPRPSPYVDMLDIFQRSVRPTGSTAMEGVQQYPNLQPQLPAQHHQQVPHRHIQQSTQPQQSQVQQVRQQQTQQPFLRVTSPGLVQDPLQVAPVAGLDATGELSQEALYQSVYGAPFSSTNLFSNPLLQSGHQLGGVGATSPAPTSVDTFDGMGVSSNPYPQPMDTASLSALGLPPTTQPLSLTTFSTMGMGMPGLFRALGPPHFQDLSPQELTNGFRGASDFFAHQFDIEVGPGRSAGDVFTEIMDGMESPAPVPQLDPVLESSPEPSSAMTTDTMHGFFPYQQHQPQIGHAASTSSVVSHSTASRSASLPSAYPSTTTSMAVHQRIPQTMPAAVETPHIYHTPPSNPSTTTPIHISHMSSPPSTTSTKEKKYQLLISRKPAIPGSTEHPGHRVFTFDSFEEFAKNFDAFMYQEFTDPAFNWEEWGLMNGVTGARLDGTNAVLQDLDFTFLVHMNNRAALYLVAKEGFRG